MTRCSRCRSRISAGHAATYGGRCPGCYLRNPRKRHDSPQQRFLPVPKRPARMEVAPPRSNPLPGRPGKPGLLFP